MAIASLTEWNELPGIICPAIKAGQTGLVLIVHKVGFLALSPQQCRGQSLRVPFEAGRFFFPTAQVGQDKGLHRLPQELGDWALSVIAVAKRQGSSPFPKRVEFGVLDGRHYAEML